MSRPALDRIEFDVSDGGVVGLVGLNGAGKTSLIRLAAGASYASDGSIFVDGFEIRGEKREASRHIGWVQDRPTFDPGAKAGKLLPYFAGFYDDIVPRDAEKRCSELLGLVGLHGNESTKLRAFSQGMLKRYAIAAAMISDPTNYLLDEVLNDLDVDGMRFVRSWLREMRSRKRAILFSSHDLAELQDLCDRVAVLHQGELLKIVSREELYGIARGLNRFVLEIDNLDTLGRDYLQSIGDVEFGDRQIRLTTKGLAAADISAELVKRGYRVSLIKPESAALESYFSHLLKGSA